MKFGVKTAFSLLILSLSFANLKAEFTCENGEILPKNPLGNCDFAGKVITSCRQGFVCDEDMDGGCFLECPEGHYIMVNYIQDSWSCETITTASLDCTNKSLYVAADPTTTVSTTTVSTTTVNTTTVSTTTVSTTTVSTTTVSTTTVSTTTVSTTTVSTTTVNTTSTGNTTTTTATTTTSNSEKVKITFSNFIVSVMLAIIRI